MRKILFNNIGNRHLRYIFNEKGQEKNLYNEKTNFKKITKQLLEKYDQEKDKVSLEILKQYLDNTDEKPDEIILFGTDQEKNNPKKSGQDTYWAALIVKKIIEEKYGFPVRVEKIEQNPSDENELLPRYQQIFVSLKYKEPDKQWIFLDAGGTPQQKFVCKLLMPEINPHTKIPYLGNVAGIDEQDLRQKNLEKIDAFYALKNAKKLVEEGHFASAHKVVEQVNSKNKSLFFIRIGENRLKNIYEPFSTPKKNLREHPVVKQYFDKEPLINNPQVNSVFPGNDEWFLYGEYLARADFYLRKDNKEMFILTFNQSLEFLLDALLKKDGDKTDSLPLKLDRNLKKFENIPDLKAILDIYAAINVGYQKHMLGKTIPMGLDSLRNRLAHEGKPVILNKSDEQNYRKITEKFKEIIEKLSLDTGSYARLNEAIKENLFLP